LLLASENSAPKKTTTKIPDIQHTGEAGHIASLAFFMEIPQLIHFFIPHIHPSSFHLTSFTNSKKEAVG